MIAPDPVLLTPASVLPVGSPKTRHGGPHAQAREVGLRYGLIPEYTSYLIQDLAGGIGPAGSHRSPTVGVSTAMAAMSHRWTVRTNHQVT